MPRAVDAVQVNVSHTVDRKTTGTRLLNIDHLSKAFTQEGRTVRVVNDVSLSVGVGETLGLVGESGAGKTTIAKLILGLTGSDSGSNVVLDGGLDGLGTDPANGIRLRTVPSIFGTEDNSASVYGWCGPPNT